MKRFVILSDINGEFLVEPPALERTPALTAHFDKTDKLSSLELAGIQNERDKDKRHQYLVAGGIDIAASKLVSAYASGITVAVGLSIGGVVLWRAIEKGLKVGSLLCFSSTRLRFETKAASCKTDLFFGEQDDYRPEPSWYVKLGLQENLVKGQGHEFYRLPIALKIFHTHLQKLL